MCTHRQSGGQDESRARLASELVQLRRKCAAAEALRDEAVAKATAAAAECERLRADLTAKDKTLSPDPNRAAAAEDRASDLESRLAAAQQSAREAAAREQEALSTLKAASSDKSKTDEQMIKTRTELDLVKEQLAAAKQGIADAAQRENEASAALKAAEKDAAAELKRTLTDKDRTDKESARLTAELDKARAQASTPHTAFSIKPFRFKNLQRNMHIGYVVRNLLSSFVQRSTACVFFFVGQSGFCTLSCFYLFTCVCCSLKHPPTLSILCVEYRSQT